MSKCKKVKNPCKICLDPVTQKTGLKCQGACQSWVHYSCLNYTPGKIRDIKNGIIKVTCPCPDCKTTLPKEYRTDQPYSCDNSRCPANQPPKCENILCPINRGMPEKMNQTPSPPCPLSTCGTSCKQHSTPQMPNIARPVPPSPCAPPAPPGYPPGFPMSPSSDACLTVNECPSGCNADTPGDYERTYPSNAMPSMNTMEQMCNTVGQLTNQINGLMMKMKEVMQDQPGGGGYGGQKQGCPQPGPKSQCPKPCYCPGNPGRRK